jgi:hypothetical protein
MFQENKPWLRTTEPVRSETKTPEIDPRVEEFLNEHLSSFFELSKNRRHHVIAEAKKLRDEYPAHTAEYKRMTDVVKTFETIK